MVLICVILMMIPKPLVAYCREKSINSKKKKSHQHLQLVSSEEKIEEKNGKGGVQIELQQVFLNDVHFFNF